MVMVSRRRASGRRKGTPWLLSTEGRWPTPNPSKNRPPEMTLRPAAAMAMDMGVRVKMGRIPVASFTRSVTIAMLVNRVGESRPAPSGTHTVS